MTPHAFAMACRISTGFEFFKHRKSAPVWQGPLKKELMQKQKLSLFTGIYTVAGVFQGRYFSESNVGKTAKISRPYFKLSSFFVKSLSMMNTLQSMFIRSCYSALRFQLKLAHYYRTQETTNLSSIRSSLKGRGYRVKFAWNVRLISTTAAKCIRRQQWKKSLLCCSMVSVRYESGWLVPFA